MCIARLLLVGRISAKHDPAESEILKQGWRDDFKDRAAREYFWMMKYALPKNQGSRRLRELKEALKALERG
jgi:hypothetical protein